MADNRLTRKRIKNHLAYGWWKYLIAAVLCGFFVDMLFAMTAYRPPRDKKIELYVCNGYADALGLQAALWPQLQARCPEQEQLTVLNINLSNDDMYASMQFSTYAAAQQGDVCILPASEVKKLTAEGADYAFAELTPYIESGVIDTRGVDVQAGTLRAENGNAGVYVLPTDTLTGLQAYGITPEKSYLCIMTYSGNADTAAQVIDLLIETMQPDAQTNP